MIPPYIFISIAISINSCWRKQDGETIGTASATVREAPEAAAAHPAGTASRVAAAVGAPPDAGGGYLPDDDLPGMDHQTVGREHPYKSFVKESDHLPVLQYLWSESRQEFRAVYGVSRWCVGLSGTGAAAGGAIATAVDDAMTALLFRHGDSEFGGDGGIKVTGQFSIEFVAAVEVDSVVYVNVRLASKESNRFNLEATVTGEGAKEGEIYATATSTFHELEQKWKGAAGDIPKL